MKGNIRVVVSIGEERKKGSRSIFKEIVEKFSNLGKEPDVQVHEVERRPNYLNAKTPSSRHIIVKLSKVNDRETTFKASWE